jgi:hypothetical protein
MIFNREKAIYIVMITGGQYLVASSPKQLMLLFTLFVFNIRYFGTACLRQYFNFLIGLA